MAVFHKIHLPIAYFQFCSNSDHYCCKVVMCVAKHNNFYICLFLSWCNPPVRPPPSRPPPMLILGTYIFFCKRPLFCTEAVPGSQANTVHWSCTGNQGPPLDLHSSFLGQQGPQATFLLFQHFERVQQTSSHLVGLATLKMLGAGQNVW